MSEFDWARCYQ